MQDLLKYQDLDFELRKATQNLNQSENRKKANDMQQYLRDTQNKLIQVNTNAGGVLNQLEKAKAEYNAIFDKIEKLLKTSDSNNLEALESCEEDVTSLIERQSRLERELNNLNTKLAAVNKDFENLMKNAKTAKGNLNFYKEEFNKEKQAIDPKIAELTEQLEAQKKKVQPELLAKYTSKAEGKIFPIFVPLTNDRCGGCRMEVPAGKIKDLQTKGYIECESCGRIIYFK